MIGKKAMEMILSDWKSSGKYAGKERAQEVIGRKIFEKNRTYNLYYDPDVRIVELVEGGVQQIMAIEVKGGTDVSKAHNRDGEAEKSRVRAKRAGYPEFWTIISTKGLNLAKLKKGSPTTNHWFDTGEVLSRNGAGNDSFRNRLDKAVGITAREEILLFPIFSTRSPAGSPSSFAKTPPTLWAAALCRA